MRVPETVESDLVIVGAGIAGLWTAKEAIDNGLSVTVVEAAGLLAAGATTRNEGWLHAGTYHSGAIEQHEISRTVAEKIVDGHNAILDFAPEAVEHDTTYALLGDEAVADRALGRWSEFGLPFSLIDQWSFDNHDGVLLDGVAALAKVEDKSIDTRMLCAKLAAHVVARGGIMYTDAEFNPLDQGTAEITITNDTLRLQSDNFLITAGVGSGDLLKKVTQDQYSMRYFKSHLMVFPRITRDNYFYVDGGQTGFMNHGNLSIAGLNRDSIALQSPDYQPVPTKERKLYEALVHLVPSARQFALESTQMVGVACVKPDIRNSSSPEPDLDESVQKVSETYTMAFPGKMTQAPHMARMAIESMCSGQAKRESSTNIEPELSTYSLQTVTPRPMDRNIVF